MDEALLLELAQSFEHLRLFTIAPRPHKPDEVMFEYLLVVPEHVKNSVQWFLSRHGENRCDVVASEIFDRLGPPAYFHRCREVSLRELVASFTARQRCRELAEQAQRTEQARRRAAERDSLSYHEVLIISPRDAITSVLERAVRSRFPEAQVASVLTPEDGTPHFHDRLDCAIVDSSIPDWGAVRAIDWLHPFLQPDCIALFCDNAVEGRVWNLVRGRGVRRLGNADADLVELLDAAHHRNVTRVARWEATSGAMQTG